MRLRAAALVGLALFASYASAESELVIGLDVSLAPGPGLVPDAAPRRLAIFEDGSVYIGGSGELAVGRLEKGELKDVEKRVARVRKITALDRPIQLGAGEQRHRLLLPRAKIDVMVTGDPAGANPSLKPLATLLVELRDFSHRSLRPFTPAFYALRASEGALPGGCRSWDFPVSLAQTLTAPQPLSAQAASGWPSGARAASVCASDKTYLVTLRPLVPGEKP